MNPITPDPIPLRLAGAALLALRELQTRLWEFTQGSRIALPFEPYHRMMLPDEEAGF